MTAWIALHWVDVLLHLILDVSGGISLRCAMGLCDHTLHRYLVWGIFAIIFSVATVAIIG